MKVKQKTVVLYDANHHGHHLTYQKLIAKMLLEDGYRVWLVSSSISEVLGWLGNNVARSKLNNFETAAVSQLSGNTYGQKQLWGIRAWIYAARKIRNLEKTHKTTPDLVLFLKIDDFVKNKGILNGAIIDLLFPYAWAGIYIHLRVPGKRKQHIINRWFYHPLAFTRSRKLKTIGILQEDIENMLKSQVSSPILVLPDVTDESIPTGNPLTERIQRKANGRKIIGLIGGQDRRKGSFLFFDIARRCAQKDWLFLFAGKMNYPKSDRDLRELQTLIGDETKWENCYFHFERIPDESHFNAVIACCDVIFAVYRNFPFSSNLMTKASLFCKPIVVSSGYLMEARVRQYGIGISCNPEILNDCIDAIESVLDHPIPPQLYDNYSHQHSKTRFLTCLQELIQSASC